MRGGWPRRPDHTPHSEGPASGPNGVPLAAPAHERESAAMATATRTPTAHDEVVVVMVVSAGVTR